jgi:putative ABC transport system permease protein
MLRNYLIVSLRNLIRHFGYTFINVFGLSIGLASFMVIGSWVYQEYSYEREFDQVERIFRTGVNFMNIGDMSVGPDILKGRLEQFANVERATNLQPIGNAELKIADKTFAQENIFRVDENFFTVFSYPFLYGDKSSVMKNPNSAVISEEVAKKLFGRTNAVGEVFYFGDEGEKYIVDGVVEVRGKSHLSIEVWLSSQSVKPQENWLSAGVFSYVFMNSGFGLSDLKENLDEILKSDLHPMLGGDQSFEEWREGGQYKFLPLPVKNIYLKSTLKFEPTPGGNETNTKIFAGVAVLILVLACINFVNISTARATTRAKEVGIRKSLGTSRSQLIFQFLLESVLICVLSTVLALGFGELFLKGFEAFTGLELLESLFGQPFALFVFFAAAVALGIAAGIYPSFYITGFQTVKVLKGQVSVNEKGLVRSGLVLFQFVISISLLVVALIVFNQLKFMATKDLGFETENVMIINNLNQVEDDKTFFKNELLKIPNVSIASINHRVPASNSLSVSGVYNEEHSEEQKWIQTFKGDYDMIDCLGYRIKAGRKFDKNFATDTSAVILNESAVKELGLKDPIGTTLNGGDLRVIGVVTDFNFETFQNKIGSAMLTLDLSGGQNMAIKFSGSNPNALIDGLNTIWSHLGAEKEPNYYFLDENFERLVQKEMVLSKAIGIFTLLAMAISCLGLYGLSMFTAERKVKEIGVRRVLGASVTSIALLLSAHFARPILIAFLLAVPIAYLLVDQWLSNYAFRIEITAGYFIAGGAIALLVGITTVSWESIKTALKDPVTSLRNE